MEKTRLLDVRGEKALSLGIELVDSVIRESIGTLNAGTRIRLKGEDACILSTKDERYGVRIPTVGGFLFAREDHLKELDRFHMPDPWYYRLAIRVKDRFGEIEVFLDGGVRLVITDDCPREASWLVKELEELKG